MNAIDKIPDAIPSLASNEFLGNAAKPDPMISTDLIFQDDATRDDTSKRKTRGIHMHTGSERTTKRPKNKQDGPAISDKEDNPFNDEDRKPAARNTTPTPDSTPSSTCPSNDEERKPAAKNTSPTPDGVPSTCASLKQKSTSTRTGSVVSASRQGVKREPVIKTETTPAPETAPGNTSTDQAEASIPTEIVINVPNLNRTLTVRRKAAKRTDPLNIAPPPPQNMAVPLSPSPTSQAEVIPVTQEPRVQEPLPTTTDEAAKKTASAGISAGLPSPAAPPSAATVDVSTRRRSRRQTQLPPTETREAQLDDSADLSGPVPPPTANVNTSIRRRSSRRVIPTRSTGTPIPPPPAALNAPTRRRSSRSVIPTSSTSNSVPPPSSVNVDVSTRRQNRHQAQLPSIETTERRLDDDDGDGDGVLSGSSWEASWEDRLNELADYRKSHGHCNVPYNYSENSKLATWVSNQRRNYRLHQEGTKTHMTLSRIQKTESRGFDWDSLGTAWKASLSELADYHRIHGHCNVPKRCSENKKLGRWVNTQKCNYRLPLNAEPSPMTTIRIQALESLGFLWDSCSAAWESRLSKLADYCKQHGHCNVPKHYSENTQLGS